MKDNSLGAEQLNQEKINQEELDKALQNFYIVKEKISLLDKTKNKKPRSLSKFKKFRLTDRLKDSDGIVEDDVYEVKYENEQKELYELKDDELMLLATIDEKNRLKLSEEEKARYEDMIRNGELDGSYKLEKNEQVSEKEFETSLGDNKGIEKANEEVTMDKNTQIAKAIGVKPENILMIVEIKDEVTMSRVLNKNVETMNLFAIKIRQDSGGLGSNDWVIINQKANGKFEEAMKDDKSDTMQDIAKTVGLKRNNLAAPDLDPYDVDTIQKNGTRYVETRINGTYMDNQEGILEVQKDGKATIHIAKEDKDGKEVELLCDEEHEHEIDEIELPDRDIDVENKEDDEEERTPGGDAYERRFEHRH